MAEIHIPTLAPETVFHIGPLPVSNTMVNAWIAIAIFLILGIVIRSSVKTRPGKLQNFMEWVIETVLGYFDQVTGDRKKTIRFLPIAGSIFFFILLSNWLGLLPGTGSIAWEGRHILRPANTDLNLTLAMALVAIIASHIFGFLTIGVFAHLGKFIQLGTLAKSIRKGPIGIFSAVVEFGVGLIEIAGEIAKVLSLSLRLFGNIFAGEVLITVISSLVSIFVPTPFMMLELLVGLIQASVFAILSLVYMTVMTAEPHGSHEEGEHH